MGGLTDDEKLFFYGDEDGRGAWRDRPWLPGDSSSDPENLQALCKSCNMAKAEANFRLATPEEAAEGKVIWGRIKAEQPSRLCDDEEKWNKVWRELASKQRKSASF